MTPTMTETGAQLRVRVARTAEAATGIARETWLLILGDVLPTPTSWYIASYHGDPTSTMIARRIAREVAEHVGYAATPVPVDQAIALFDWPAARADIEPLVTAASDPSRSS